MISPVHYNNNLICVIDCETTGLNPGHHDMIQLCIIPVAPDYTVNKQLKMFHVKMQPTRYGNVDDKAVNRADLADAINNGMDPDRAEMRFREWFNALPLRPGKKIVPLGHNYANMDRPFIMDWLGGALCYEEFFRSDSRDSMQLALGINDMCDCHNERIPFPKVNLSYLCTTLGFKRETRDGGRHDAIMDCLATLECYKRLMRFHHYADPTGTAKAIKKGPDDALRLSDDPTRD